MALRVLREAGMSDFEPRSKSWDEFARNGAPTMDLVITVCASAAGESCPVWPGAPLRAHWGLPDPAAVEGPEDSRLGAFREAFGVLQYRVRQFLALPLADMDAAMLARRLAEIGESLPGAPA
jgi:arsenate reductase